MFKVNNEDTRTTPVAWKILLTAPTNTELRTILELSIIALKRSNEQFDFDQFILIRNNVTHGTITDIL